MNLPILYQRLEGAALLIACLLLNSHTGQSWWMFVAVLIFVDISAAGYIINTRLGAHLYNVGHSAIVPILLLAIGFMFDGQSPLLGIAIAWLAHVGMDRALGFGLKFPDSFKHTHLGMIGKIAKR